MEIQLSPKSARAMAARLRQEMAPNVSVSESQELLAKVLGYHNWDTLSGMLKKQNQQSEEERAAFMRRATVVKYRETPPQDFAPFMLYADAYACDEWGEGPRWFELEVTPALVKRLHELQTLALERGLDISQESYDGEWGDADHLSLQGDEVNVSYNSFWFTAHPKHSNYKVECRYIQFDELFSLIEQGEQANSVYFAWCDGKLFRDPNRAKDLAESLYDDGHIEVDEDKLDAMPVNDLNR